MSTLREKDEQVAQKKGWDFSPLPILPMTGSCSVPSEACVFNVAALARMREPLPYLQIELFRR